MNRSTWLGLAFLFTWILSMCGFAMLGGRACRYMIERLTVPHCEQQCRGAGARFERLRQHTKNGPSEACLCSGGVVIEPSFLESTALPTLAAIVGVVLANIAAMIALARLFGRLDSR